MVIHYYMAPWILLPFHVTQEDKDTHSVWVWDGKEGRKRLYGQFYLHYIFEKPDKTSSFSVLTSTTDHYLTVWIFCHFVSVCLSSIIQTFSFYLTDICYSVILSECMRHIEIAIVIAILCNKNIFFLIPHSWNSPQVWLSHLSKNHRTNRRVEGWLTASHGTHETSHMTGFEYHVGNGFLESVILVTSLHCQQLNIK